MQAIDGFPSIEEFGINVVNTAWIITQHADNDIGFQQRVLQEMYKTKNNNETGVNLVCFYYLADRITMTKYGYQFFGTQNNGENTIELPEKTKENFLRNPSYICSIITLQKIETPESGYINVNNESLYKLWQLTDEGAGGVQSGMVQYFLEKYKLTKPFLDKVPKTNWGGQKAKKTLAERALESNHQIGEKWAGKLYEMDQFWRSNPEIVEEFFAKGRKINEMLSNAGITTEEELEIYLTEQPKTYQQSQTQKAYQEYKTEEKRLYRDEEAQELLNEFIEKYGFPGSVKFGIKEMSTAFIVYQHADKNIEMQKKGLMKMYESKQENPRNVSLVYFYYLTDRITMKYGYQFFGTQENEKNLIKMPQEIMAEFMKDPAKCCAEILIKKLGNTEGLDENNTSDLYKIWKLADDNKLSTEGQESIIPEFLEKYKPTTKP